MNYFGGGYFVVSLCEDHPRPPVECPRKQIHAALKIHNYILVASQCKLTCVAHCSVCLSLLKEVCVRKCLRRLPLINELNYYISH